MPWHSLEPPWAARPLCIFKLGPWRGRSMGGPKLGCIKSTGTDPKGALLPPSKTPLSPSLLPHPPGGPARAVAHWAGSDNDSRELVGVHL